MHSIKHLLYRFPSSNGSCLRDVGKAKGLEFRLCITHKATVTVCYANSFPIIMASSRIGNPQL